MAEPFDFTYRPMKYLGALDVEYAVRLPAVGWDNDYGVAFPRETEALLLHAEAFDGAHELRQGLRRAADYITYHDSLAAVSYVVGLTYAELGNLAMRFGFRAVTACGPIEDDAYARSLQEQYDTVRRTAGRPRQSVEPCMVYLPTQNFITRFGSRPITHLDFT